MPHRRAEVAIFKLDNVRLEFVAPAAPDSPLHAYLEANGEGFFHLGFAVEDVDTALRELNARGYAARGEPHTGYKDWRIAYLESEAAGPIAVHVINSDAE